MMFSRYVDPSKLQAEISCRNSKPKATPPRPSYPKGSRASETGTVIEVGQVAKIYTDVDVTQPSKKKKSQTTQRSNSGRAASPRKLGGKAGNLEEQFQKHFKPDDGVHEDDHPAESRESVDVYDDEDNDSPYALYEWQDGDDCEVKMQRRRDELLLIDDIETREVRDRFCIYIVAHPHTGES